MTKREEIREGIAEEICKVNGGIWNAANYNDYWENKADKVLSYLHSQGVVVRVERELPEIRHECICEKYPDLAETGEVGDGQFHACEDAQQDMLKAGYGATKPLIEVEK